MRARFKSILTLALAAVVLAAPGRAPAASDPVADFYRGKVVTIIVHVPAGSVFDLHARLLARYMPRYLPGAPTIIIKNMGGAGGLTATRYLYASAPQDGTVIGTITRAIPFEPLLGGANGVDFDPLKFHWLGSTSTETGMAFARAGATVKNARDLLTTELVVAGTGAGADSEILPSALNGLVGTHFKIVHGYDDVINATLAMERGEIDGFGDFSYGALNTSHPDWIPDKKVNILFQGGRVPNPNLLGVPLVTSLAHSPDEKQAIEMLYARDLLARPFLAPPGTPEDRVQALRAAFAASLRDPQLLADAAAANTDIDLVTGEEIERILKQAFAMPPALIQRIQAALGR
jgi:tripartite-type tricarboxylate transporter receptor subunit TctC